MKLGPDYSETIVARIKREPAFAVALLDEAAAMLINGEAVSARLTLRHLVHGLMGFEALAVATGTPPKSLHRMLSVRGNPGMDTLGRILAALTHAAINGEATVRISKAAA